MVNKVSLVCKKFVTHAGRLFARPLDKQCEVDKARSLRLWWTQGLWSLNRARVVRRIKPSARTVEYALSHTRALHCVERQPSDQSWCIQ